MLKRIALALVACLWASLAFGQANGVSTFQTPGNQTVPGYVPLQVNPSGLAGGFSEFVGAPVTAAGTTGQIVIHTFTPCLRANSINQSILVSISALGAGGVNQSVAAWGYQQ